MKTLDGKAARRSVLVQAGWGSNGGTWDQGKVADGQTWILAVFLFMTRATDWRGSGAGGGVGSMRACEVWSWTKTCVLDERRSRRRMTR
jgi:hypothetical protein